MTNGYIYVLHFNTPIAHARHYVGCTSHLKQRLSTHAIGHGSRLTRELHDRGYNWTLAALYQAPLAVMRRVERAAKDQKNGPRLCSICRARDHDEESPPPLFGYIRSLPIEMVPFPTTSEHLALTTSDLSAVIVRTATGIDTELASMQIKRIMRQTRDCLGFIPIGGHEGFVHLFERGQVTIAERDGQLIGWTAYTIKQSNAGLCYRPRLTIVQTCVDDAHRLTGVGKALVEHTERARPDHLLHCRVRQDLPANEFWSSIGYNNIGTSIHNTSLHILCDYEKEPFDVRNSQ